MTDGNINGRDAKDYDPYSEEWQSALWSPGFTAAIEQDGTVRPATSAEKAAEHKEFAKKGAAQRKDQDDRARQAERESNEEKAS